MIQMDLLKNYQHSSEILDKEISEETNDYYFQKI